MKTLMALTSPVAAQFGGTPPAPENGADGDGSNGIGSEDLDIWMDNFSEIAGPSFAMPVVLTMAVTEAVVAKGDVSSTDRDWTFAGLTLARYFMRMRMSIQLGVAGVGEAGLVAS